MVMHRNACQTSGQILSVHCDCHSSQPEKHLPVIHTITIGVLLVVHDLSNMAVLDERLPDTQAEFRPARGCRDNVCAIRWFDDMVLWEGRQAVVTFIDYNAAFEKESQLFIECALAGKGVSSKVRSIVQTIFAAATDVVRMTGAL